MTEGDWRSHSCSVDFFTMKKQQQDFLPHSETFFATIGFNEDAPLQKL